MLSNRASLRYRPRYQEENDEGKDLICGETQIRTIHVENGCTKECERRYMLYLPRRLCSTFSNSSAGIFTATDTLPLVFSVHCLGCNLATLEFWAEIAEKYKFVWVNPEGLGSSFNAGNESCCGYALQQRIDDLGFFRAIIQELEVTHSFVDSNWVYGMGWSNGGYMVSSAASLFKAIAPISGYQIEAMNVPKPTGLFLHHSSDDNFVQMTGCCTNSSMPKCCCGLSNFANQCISAGSKAQQWAKQFNRCQEKSSAQITYSVQDQVTCYSYNQCRANTTYCVHQHKGHFNRPSFRQAFDMNHEIADFFARDACQGIWSSSSRTCDCPNNLQGLFCLDEKTSRGTDSKPTVVEESYTADGSTTVTANSLLVGVLVGTLVMAWVGWYRRRRNHPSKQGFAKLSTVELRQL